MELIHHCSSPRLGTDSRILLDLFQTFRQCAFNGKRRSRQLRGRLWRLHESLYIVSAQYLRGTHGTRVGAVASLEQRKGWT